MIVIDGQQSNMEVKNFDNLADLLIKVMDHDVYRDRIVTDVLVNQEQFTEIYPNQAEDLASREINSVEIKTLPISEMAINITRELYKVIRLMAEGGRQVSSLFRRAEDGEALETYQDLLEVVRDFMGMVGVLREEFTLKENIALNDSVEELSDLFSEMIEVQENEDWILLADLLEYEFLPLVEKWKKVIAQLREDIKENLKASR